MPVLAAGEGRPIKGKSGADEFGCEVPAVAEVTFGNRTVVGQFGLDMGGYDLPLAELDERPFGLLTPWMIEFGGVYAREAQANIVDDDGVAIDHPAAPTQDADRRSGPRALDHDNGAPSVARLRRSEGRTAATAAEQPRKKLE